MIEAFAPKRVLRQQLMRGDISMATASDEAAVNSLPESETSWVQEQLTPQSRFGYRATACEKVQTPFQQLELLETPQFGKVLRIDGRFMTSEKRSFSIMRPWCIRLPWRTRRRARP